MDKKALIEQLIRDAHEKAGFTGTWLYAENGEILSEGAVGWSDPCDTVPLREEFVFDLASVTKQFTATAVMLLKREGLLDLDDEITKFFPAIPYKGVTVRHLLTHTGGLPDYMEWVEETAKAEKTIPGNDIIVRFLSECQKDPDFAPGEKWEYSNTGYCLLAEIVEKVSGVKFEEFLKKNIFDPAGMTATRVYHRRKDGIAADDLAYGMILEIGSDQYLLPDDSPDGDYVVPLDGVNGDGLVHSSVLDLYKWDRALRAEKVLTKEEQQQMYTPAKLNNGEPAGDPEDEDGSAYGFGWFVDDDPERGRIVCHSGGWPGYNTFFERFVDADRVLIFLSCREALDEKANISFFHGLRAVLRDKEPEPVQTIEELAIPDPDRSGWEALTGKYDYVYEDFCINEICQRDGNLFAEITYRGKEQELRLYPMKDNSFGVKIFSSNITFGEEGLTLWGKTGKKL